MANPSVCAALLGVLDGALAATGTTLGNIQALDGHGVLEIVAQRGFDPEFLSLFAKVHFDEPSACGRALRLGQRVVIRDVTADPYYAPYRSAACRAGYRCVQSTPIRAADGTVVGVLSTHYRTVRRLTEVELRALDALAAEAGAVLESWHRR